MGRGIIDPDRPRFRIRVKSGHKASSNGSGWGLRWEGQYVHVQDVLAETSDVLAHVGAEARDQTRGNGLAVFGHGRKRLGQVCDVG